QPAGVPVGGAVRGARFHRHEADHGGAARERAAVPQQRQPHRRGTRDPDLAVARGDHRHVDGRHDREPRQARPGERTLACRGWASRERSASAARRTPATWAACRWRTAARYAPAWSSAPRRWAGSATTTSRYWPAWASPTCWTCGTAARSSWRRPTG